MSKTIVVGISDLNVAQKGDILVTYALGSCVGICLYDPGTKIAGLSHIMLPTISDFPNCNTVREKFADAAIEILMQKMLSIGVMKIRLRAKIAGGAQMFSNMTNLSLAAIGERNVLAVKQELLRLRIPVVAEDTGKNYGRTVFFNSDEGIMKVKSVNLGERLF